MSRPTKISPDIIGSKSDLGSYVLKPKDTILYALGIGFSRDPLNTDDFKFTYELDQRFSIFPTIASCLGQQTSMRKFDKQKYLPEFSLHTVLHGEERLHMVHPTIKINAEYVISSETIDVIDRGEGKGAFIADRISAHLIDEKGEKQLAFFVDRNIFYRSLGGSGVKSTGKLIPIPSIPKRKHDLILKQTTYSNQAILYRLNSDPNPLHIDPKNAKLAGFPRPIIHGLATYGTVVRSIVQNLLESDQQRVKSVETRFTGHVFPGESLEIKIWKYLDSLEKVKGCFWSYGTAGISEALKSRNNLILKTQVNVANNQIDNIVMVTQELQLHFQNRGVDVQINFNQYQSAINPTDSEITKNPISLVTSNNCSILLSQEDSLSFQIKDLIKTLR